MSSSADIEVTIEFKRLNRNEWEAVELTPDQFFDLNPGETAALESVPRHTHAIAYLDVDVRTVRMTRLTISDKAGTARRRISETFWNDGQNRVIERVDSGREPYWQLIFETRVSERPTVWEILKLGREGDGVLIPLYHGRIRDNEDGSQTETQESLV